MDFGLNLYSIRNLIQSESDFMDTSLKLRDMGYSCMQYSGGPYDPEVMRRVSRTSGLPIVVTHVPLDRILNDTDALMREHAYFGCKNIGLGKLPNDMLLNRELYKATVDKLELSAEKMAGEGFSFFYHNHQFDLYQIDGKPAIDYMIECAPSIHFILDTYWLQYGGVSIMDYVEKMSGRIEFVHLKDYKVAARKDGDNIIFKPTFAPVGDGTTNFKALVPKMLEAGTKYFLVEQDDAAKHPDPLVPIKRSIDYLKANF